MRRMRVLLLTGVILGLLGGVLAFAQPPRIAPLNPQFVEYQLKLQSGEPPSVLTKSGHHLGFIPPPVSLSYINRGQLVHIFRQALPPCYDLRTQGRLTPVKDQGQYGTCWAHATYGSLESCTLTTSGEVWDFSENNLVNWTADTYDPLAPGTPLGWNGGNSILSTAYLSGWVGPVQEADDPYPNPGSWTQKPVRKHIQQVLFLPDRTGPMDNDVIKQAVMQYGAVYTGMYYDDAYFNPATNAYYYNGSAPGNHAVCIVGWDDNYPRTNFLTQPPGDGAFIVRNSWGSSWGEGGYFYISYYDSQIGIENTVFPAGDDVNNYTNIYQYDTLGITSLLGYGSYTAWFANIFTAVSDEPISAVSFYAVAPNSTYTLYIYTNVSAGQPRSGTLAGTKKGIIPISGYYTVPLDAPVPIASGQRFSVVINITTPGIDMPIPVEMPIPGFSSKATAHPGESFISPDGAVWDDVTTYYYNTNVCIKAFSGLPTFSGGAYTPLSGTPSTLFTFSLLYNIPSKPLQYVKLELINTTTGKTYESDMSSTDGKHYRARVYLERGVYNYYFLASDGSVLYRYPGQGTMSGPKVNTPPLLSNGKVTPSMGAPGGTFTYTVEYSDPDVDPADYVKLHISQDGSEITGSPFTMTSKDGKTWSYSLQLYKATGYKYSFFFSASDGIDETSTEPVEGPVVNNPPQLLNPSVQPTYGQVGDKFTFSVKYKDVDGDPPQNFKFHLVDPQGTEISTPAPVQDGQDPKAGITFSIKDVQLNSPGTYVFWFEVDDAVGAHTTSNQASVGVGVVGVQTTPAELDILSQRDGVVNIGISYKPKATVSLTITNPAGKTFSKDVTTDDNGLATYTLPTSEISLDTLGTWKVDATDKATGGSSGSASFIVKGTHQFPSTIDMVSLPLGFTNTKISDVLKDQMANLLLKWWNPAQGQYVDASTLNTGMGFWMKTQNGNPPSLTLYAGSLLSSESTVALRKGWNIIGSPLLSDIDISSLQVQYGGQKVSLETANKNGWVRDYLWGYDPSSKDYLLIHPALSGDQRTVEAWKGYWIKALVDGAQLVFTPGRKPSSETRNTKPEGWMVQLIAESAQGRDACNYIGMGDSRFYGGVENPPAKAGVDLYILRNNEKLAWDVREKADRAEWGVVVEGAGEVSLSWPNLSQLPKGYGLFLIDGDKRINMLTSSRYVFSSDGYKELKVVFEKRADSLLISGLMAKAVRGSGVNVSFSLSGDADVNVAIKRVDGSVVKVMTRSASAGLNSVVWDGRDGEGKPLPAGVYIVEVVARSSDGSYVKGITMFNLR